MPANEHSFRKAEHLRRPAEFRRVYDRRCWAGAQGLTIYGCANGLPHARVGFSVGRKVGGAVVRNRIRRLFREAFRLSRRQLPLGLDLVFIPRGRSVPELRDLQRVLTSLCAEVARKLAHGEKRP